MGGLALRRSGTTLGSGDLPQPAKHRLLTINNALKTTFRLTGRRSARSELLRNFKRTLKRVAENPFMVRDDLSFLSELADAIREDAKFRQFRSDSAQHG